MEIVLDEMEAARKALDRARPGDVVVLCVDYATEVYKELEKRRGSATPSAMGASEHGLIEAQGGDTDLIDLSGVHAIAGGHARGRDRAPASTRRAWLTSWAT